MNSGAKLLFSITALFLLFTVQAFPNTGREQEIGKLWKQFQANPAQVLNAVPPKWDAQGKPISPKVSSFSTEMIENGDFVLAKNRAGKSEQGRSFHLSPAPYEGTDGVDTFLDELKYQKLEEIQKAGLSSARVTESPWSGDYWPTYQGIIARRYADGGFPGSEDWKANADYVLANLNVNSSSVENLSPAEKYDLLVGDANHSLTQTMLNVGKGYYDREGKVETWMGICHGWAPAAFEVARPEHGVTVLAADGKTKINFYPSDIKGLVTALWANSDYATRFAGRRCDKKDPETDENGRTLDSECFDENPGAWHLLLVNRLGVSKKSFVIDATFDYQVWNQPVHSYEYTLFNPQTGETVDSIEKAKVSKEDFSHDKFAKYRSSQAESFVGVTMDLTYVAETSASTVMSDSSDNDRLVTVRYMYDLELDKKGNIIGGEWYMNRHPDFLWMPEEGTHVHSVGDYYLDRDHAGQAWDGKSPVSKDWLGSAVSASKRGQPLAKVVDTLVVLSKLGIR